MFLLPRPAAPFLIQHLLYSIEEVLRYNGLLDTLVEFSRPIKVPTIHRIGQNFVDAASWNFPLSGTKILRHALVS